MKDIMQKLAELEATAPKVSKKKMLNEDSTTPPMNVSNKPASLKDLFNSLSENVVTGQKPLPVLDPQNKQAGMGFVTSNNPAVQNMLKNLDPKDVQIVQAPGQPGQPQVGQQQQQQPTGQPAQAGATGQPQAGQMQMKEKWDAETKVAPSEKGKYAGKTKAELTSQYNKLKASGPHHKGSPEFGKMRELAFAIRAKSDWGKVQEEQLDELSRDLLDKASDAAWERGRKVDPSMKSDNRSFGSDSRTGPGKFWQNKADKFEKAGTAAAKRDTVKYNYEKEREGMSPAQRRQYDAMNKSGELAEKQLDEKLTKSMSAGDVISDFEKSKDPKFKGKSKEERKKQALGAYYGMHPEKSKKKVKEGDLPSSSGVDTRGAGLGVGRDEEVLESKSISAAVDKREKQRQSLIKKAARELNSKTKPTTAEQLVKKYDLFPKDAAAIKKMAKELNAENMSEGAKPDFFDLDKDGDKKEPMSKAAADKKKQKVKESMNHRISAARLEGKSHGLRGHAHSGKRYEDLDEIRAYHEGYKEGLDECYGQGVYETAMPATVPGMADEEMLGELSPQTLQRAAGAARARARWGSSVARQVGSTAHSNLAAKDMALAKKADAKAGVTEPTSPNPSYDWANKGGYGMDNDPALKPKYQSGMEEGNAFTAALAKTPKGGKFSVGGKSFTDTSSLEEYAFESLDNQLNALLNESTDVNEGLSVSISKGQENSPDSVTITAQDAEAEHLLAFVKNAGLGLFGDDNADTHSSAMSVQPSHGAPDEIGAGGAEIGVVDGHDGMMGLMQKLSGIQSDGAEDYADEEGGCGCEEGSCSCDDYDQPTNEGTCNECGMMEAQCGCSGDKEMVDEVEDDEDHDEWHDKDGNVDPNGAHDAGGHYYRERDQVDEVETPDQELEMAAEDNAPDSGEAESTADEDAEAKEDAALAGADSGDEEEMNESDEEDEEDVTESNAFESIYKKFAMLEAAANEEEDEEEDVTESEEDEEEDAIEESEDLNEWANQIGDGPGKGTDASFQQDIDFMTKVISGGLNKPKSTGQTTTPVIAGQDTRMHDNPMDWATLAGIKK